VLGVLQLIMGLVLRESADATDALSRQTPGICEEALVREATCSRSKPIG
jgi:hypothetical protein